MEPVYSVTVNAKGGWEGSVWTEEGSLNLELTTPSIFGGQEQLRTNYPELFGRRFNCCLLSKRRAAGCRH
ncbi:hypothetical protein L2D08_02795 [Domibacillus sp. PGB-M46]|uniref:hypothetical protein n=1 Tax=Domibacillus sp. PGB-M46 TaxID=2910255 RepID=UPI001F58AF59|nr:hypothetical protein [Domibacillus sp. PGB-M46]MCI2253291.1 hypothetical protein [Domibacillus sp. PGB-M46]